MEVLATVAVEPVAAAAATEASMDVGLVVVMVQQTEVVGTVEVSAGEEVALEALVVLAVLWVQVVVVVLRVAERRVGVAMVERACDTPS